MQTAARERDRLLCRSEVVANAQKLADVEAKLIAEEHEACSMRKMLSENQSSLLAWQAEQEKSDKTSASTQERLQQEVKDAVAAARSASEHEAVLTRQLDDLKATHKEECNLWGKELNELKELGSQQAATKERM